MLLTLRHLRCSTYENETQHTYSNNLYTTHTLENDMCCILVASLIHFAAQGPSEVRRSAAVVSYVEHGSAPPTLPAELP